MRNKNTKQRKHEIEKQNKNTWQKKEKNHETIKLEMFYWKYSDFYRSSSPASETSVSTSN